MPTFAHSFNPASEAELKTVEQRLGVRFPKDYRKFLRDINGGSPTPACFAVPQCGPALVDMFYGIHTQRTHADLEYEREEATQWEPLPEGFVVIGHDPGNSLLLIGTLKDDAGKVYFWDRVGFWTRKDGRNTFLVAQSFAAFLDSLRETPANKQGATLQLRCKRKSVRRMVWSHWTE
jgi:hypothetical protein